MLAYHTFDTDFMSPSDFKSTLLSDLPGVSGRDQAPAQMQAQNRTVPSRTPSAHDTKSQAPRDRPLQAPFQASLDQAPFQAPLDQAHRDQALRDQALRDQALRDQALRDQALRDQAHRDQALRDQALHDAALHDAATHAQMSRELVPSPIRVPFKTPRPSSSYTRVSPPPTVKKTALNLDGADVAFAIGSIVVALAIHTLVERTLVGFNLSAEWTPSRELMIRATYPIVALAVLWLLAL